MLKRLSFSALITLSAAALSAQNTTVRYKVFTESLLPGRRIHVEMRANYVYVEFTAAQKSSTGAAKPQAQEHELYKLPADGVFVWDAIVSDKGVAVPVHDFTFRFSKPLAPAPSGVSAYLMFPTKWTMTCPQGTEDRCKPFSGDQEFGLPVTGQPPAAFGRCLQFRGVPGNHVVILTSGDDCADPRKDPHTFVR
jgi:hypothetical protein